MLFTSLFVAAVLVAVTSTVHFAGLVGLSWVMRRGYMMHPDRYSGVIWQAVTIVGLVFCLFSLHSIQIWIYALTYLMIGQFDTLEPALYFATSTFTTVGFGEIVLTPEWRMLSAAESANGFLLIGWSTAFLVSISARVRMFEAEVDRGDD